MVGQQVHLWEREHSPTLHRPVSIEERPPRQAGDLERVSVVLPAKNEVRNIPWVLERIPSWVDEVVLVDGLSRDETVAIARMLKPDLVVVHEERAGKGRALRSGFDAATGDIIVMLDADGSMDPMEMSRFVDAIRQGNDFVKGSRFLRNGGTGDITRIRWAGNLALLALTNLLYRRRYSDLCYGYCALRRDKARSLHLDADGFEIEMQLVARFTRLGYRVAEVPSYESPRRFGHSNLHAVRDGIRVFKTLVRERLRQPVRELAMDVSVSIQVGEGRSQTRQ